MPASGRRVRDLGAGPALGHVGQLLACSLVELTAAAVCLGEEGECNRAIPLLPRRL